MLFVVQAIAVVAIVYVLRAIMAVSARIQEIFIEMSYRIIRQYLL